MRRSTRHQLYPLKFELLPKEKVWGGQKLKGLAGVKAEGEGNIGEVWVVWDGLAVANGSWQGRTLKSLVDEFPREILGSSVPKGPDTIFPLLVKLIDAHDTLSVQVHPDDGYSRAREHQPFGKTEMWYVLEAEPGARIVHGLNRPLDRTELQRALDAGTVTDVLDYVPVAKGDTVFLPAGTIHALGKGLMVYELQESSDLTYRLYDWGRKEAGGVTRELHVDKSLDVARLAPLSTHKIRPVELREGGYRRRFLCACSYFAAELLATESRVLQQPGGRFHIVTALEGAVSLRSTGGESEELILQRLETALVPGGLAEYAIRPLGDRCELVKSYVPDLLKDVAGPLLRAGVPADDVVQLGGDPNYSELGHLIASREGRGTEIP